MKFILTRLALFLLLAFLAQTGKAQVYTTEEGHAEVYGENAMTSYTGTSDQLEGRIDRSSGGVDFELKLESLKTGNEMRDGHMYETLETGKFPKAHFEGALMSKVPEAGEVGSVRAKGTFTIHGVSKEIVVSGVMGHTKGQLKLEAEFTIAITDYGMDPPGYSLMAVRDKHDIKIEAELEKVGS